MTDYEARQQRFMRHSQERRLGNLSTNLNRIALYSEQGSDPNEIRYFIQETKHFTDWASQEASLEVQMELVEIQRQLSKWTLHWDKTWQNTELRQRMNETSRAWSEKVLEWAGIR
jgi:hypothetical protein